MIVAGVIAGSLPLIASLPSSERAVSRSAAARTAAEPAGPAAAAPREPRGCADAAACDDLAAALDRTDPAGALIARGQACELGQKYTCLEAADAWARGSAGTRDAARAIALRRRGCELGAADACADAGDAYRHGDGAAPDLERGRALLERGCQLGSRLGCRKLAVIYRDGDGVPADPGRAFELAARACDDGAAVDTALVDEIGAACLDAADALRDGRGTRRDRARAADYERAAVDWFDMACRAAAAHCTGLGAAFDAGRGVAASPRKARELFQAACDAGNQAACLRARHREGGR
ncbi:MAG TPA: hypothetical protein VK601_14105 [Kofleriaceae bacterium]|nr:hypothetical protein [Kofleriaceae bacterium]